MCVAQNWCLLHAAIKQNLRFHNGPVAQLIERVVRNDEVVGLIPIRSTNQSSPCGGPKPIHGNAVRMWLLRSASYFLAVLLVTLQLRAVEAAGSTIKTNGNGEPVDVGMWYCSNWDAHGGGWWNLATYRPLLPDGSYGMHDGSDSA